MGWLEILGYIASGSVFVTFWMKTLITLRLVAIAGNVLYLAYGLNAEIGNIIMLHGSLLPLNLFRLYKSVTLRKKLHQMAHADFDPTAITSFMTEMRRAKGEYLFKRGDTAQDIFYLVEGKVCVEELGIELDAGQLIGEIAMFTADKKRTQSVKCIENCKLMQITEEKALQIYAENPEFGMYVTKMMVERLLNNSENGAALKAA